MTTGKLLNTVTTNDLGEFFIPVALPNSFEEIINDGFYFDEVSGVISDANISLRTLADLSASTAITVNILTHLEQSRLKYLVGQGTSFPVADVQTQSKVLAMYNIDATGLGEFHKMDVTELGDVNAALLAVSAVTQQMAINRAASSGSGIEGELQALLSAMNTDIAFDGVLNSTSIQQEILGTSYNLDLVAVRPIFPSA